MFVFLGSNFRKNSMISEKFKYDVNVQGLLLCTKNSVVHTFFTGMHQKFKMGIIYNFLQMYRIAVKFECDFKIGNTALYGKNNHLTIHKFYKESLTV